jgi:Ca2+-binding RTX toxin-like protein
MDGGLTECGGLGPRARRTLLVAFLSAVVSVAHADPAVSSIVRVGPGTALPGSTAVIYVADAGEANRVTMSDRFEPPSALRVVDPGATISVGAGCTSVIGDDGEALEGDTIRPDIEHIVGGNANDVLAGSITGGGSIEGVPFLIGAHLEGRRGNDVLLGGRSHDRLFGGRGDDVVRGGPGADSISGDPGADRLIAGRGRDRLSGGKGPDRLFARDGQADLLFG